MARQLLAVAVAASAPLGAQPRCGPSAPAAPAPVVTVTRDTLAIASFDSAVALIARTHFDSAYNGVPWSRLADSLRPSVVAANRRDTTRAAIRLMLDRLGQSHFALIDGDAPRAADVSEEAPAGSLGLDVRWIERSLVVSAVTPGGPADRAGLRPGSRLVTVGDCDVAEQVARVQGRAPEAMQSLALTSFGRALLAPTSREPVRVVFDTGRTAPLLVTRALTPGASDERLAQLAGLGRVPFTVSSAEARAGGRRFGVLRFSIWVPPVIAPLDSAVDRFRDADGMIIDLRGNTGGVAGIAMGLGGHFIDSVAPLGVMRQRGATLRLVTNPRRVSTALARVQPYDGPVAILVDGLSASTSEFFAAGLQALGRARVFGERTPGMALPALTYRLPNGDVVYHAIADFHDAGGRRLEGIGVVPDTPVTPTRAALLAGHDPVYDAAVAWLQTQPRPRPVGPAHR